MPTPGERRALIFLAALAALGVTARGVIAMRGNGKTSVTGDRAGLARQIVAVDSAIASGGVKRRGGRVGSAGAGSRNGLAPTSRKRASGRSIGDTVVVAPRSYRGLPPANPVPPARDNREAYWRAREHVDSLRQRSMPVRAESRLHRVRLLRKRHRPPAADSWLTWTSRPRRKLPPYRSLACHWLRGLSRTVTPTAPSDRSWNWSGYRGLARR